MSLLHLLVSPCLKVCVISLISVFDCFVQSTVPVYHGKLLVHIAFTKLGGSSTRTHSSLQEIRNPRRFNRKFLKNLNKIRYDLGYFQSSGLQSLDCLPIDTMRTLLLTLILFLGLAAAAPALADVEIRSSNDVMWNSSLQMPGGTCGTITSLANYQNIKEYYCVSQCLMNAHISHAPLFLL